MTHDYDGALLTPIQLISSQNSTVGSLEIGAYSSTPSTPSIIGSITSTDLESDIRPLTLFFDTFLKQRIDNNGMLTAFVKIQTDPER
jgi:hypothetical protein